MKCSNCGNEIAVTVGQGEEFFSIKCQACKSVVFAKSVSGKVVFTSHASPHAPLWTLILSIGLLITSAIYIYKGQTQMTGLVIVGILLGGGGVARYLRLKWCEGRACKLHDIYEASLPEYTEEEHQKLISKMRFSWRE